MRVAIIIYRISRNRGGAEKWTHRYIQWLAARDVRVHLVASRPPSRKLADAMDQTTILASSNRFEFARRVASEFDRREVDVVHDMGFGYECDVFHPHSGSQFALDAARANSHYGLSRAGFLFARRFGHRQRRLAELSRQQFGQPAARFVAVSRRVARDLQLHHGLTEDRIHVVSNGVDTRDFSPAMRATFRDTMRQRIDASPGSFVLLTVAHNHRLKGIPELLRMLESTDGPRLHLVVVGGRTRKRELMPTGNQVTFVGTVDDVRPWYAAADAFVLATHYDACSLTVLEAMACGLPVITTRANGASEMIDNGETGLIVDHAGDLRGLRAAVETCRLAGNRQRLGEAARAAALQMPIEQNFESIANIYEAVLRDRSRTEKAA